jgi:hypothetical protein
VRHRVSVPPGGKLVKGSPLISRRSPRLVDSVFWARSARLARYAVGTTSTKFEVEPA